MRMLGQKNKASFSFLMYDAHSSNSIKEDTTKQKNNYICHSHVKYIGLF